MKSANIKIKAGLLIAAITIMSLSCEQKNNCKTCPSYGKQSKKTEREHLVVVHDPVEEAPTMERDKLTRSSSQQKPKRKKVRPQTNYDYKKDQSMELTEMEETLQDADYSASPTSTGNVAPGYYKSKKAIYHSKGGEGGMVPVKTEPAPVQHNTESYDAIRENSFLEAKINPLSTFSIDVDNASYTNTRRFLNNGSLPPKDAVRIEEFINYFHYAYKEPRGEDPFSINTEIGAAPWNPNHKLVHIGLQGKTYEFNEIEPMNLVFLIDVSGSMSSSNKLPLLKKSYEMLVSKLRSKDNIAIVVYAGAAGVVLPSTPGSNKKTILKAIDKLQAGGSTAGGAGIKLAYNIAQENFKENGVNRVILATDGDFNVGASSNAEMTRLIEEKRENGVFLTVLGFGMGNYKDSRMETIADNGNGNYFYIDNIQESNKVLVDELGSTLYTIAKDVKLQIEFNPNKVQAYRLIGYENRMLKKEDFNDDKKDAGELGAGHTVTALYEIIPVGVKSEFIKNVDPLKYQIPNLGKTSHDDELLTVKFRYKKPDGHKSKLIVHPLKDDKEYNNSENFNFSAAVAGFGMLLRDSEFKQDLTYDKVIKLARAGKGEDKNGYRSEFIQLVKTAQMLGGIAQK